MAIRGIEETQVQAPPPGGATGGNTALGKDEFLQLLVTQMQYQDPLSPMDNAAFTAQLAQFSSLEQLFEVNGNLSGLTTAQQPSGMASVAGFVGREITATGDGIILGDDGASPAQFTLDGPAETANVLVHDAAGVTVRNIPLGKVPGGTNEVVWDGLDDTGNSLPPGNYRFSVVAQDAQGDVVNAHTEVRGRVTGAVYDGDEAYLTVGARQVGLSELIEVRTPDPVVP